MKGGHYAVDRGINQVMWRPHFLSSDFFPCILPMSWNCPPYWNQTFCLFLSLLYSVTSEELHLLRITVLLVYTILLYAVHFFNIWDCFKQFSALLLRCLRMWHPVVQGSRSLFGFSLVVAMFFSAHLHEVDLCGSHWKLMMTGHFFVANKNATNHCH